MARTNPLVRMILVTLLVACGVLAGPRPAEATHFRYGHLTWRKKANTTVEFTLVCAFERSGYAGTAADGFLAVGDEFPEIIGGTNLVTGDGTTIGGDVLNSLRFVAVAIDPVKDFVVARALDPNTGKDRIEHAYATPSNGGQPWLARISSCCRISTLQNNADEFYQVATEIDLSVNRFSAVSSLPPIIPVPPSGTQFPVPGVDNDRDQTRRYRLADPAEAGGPFGVFVHPTGVTIDPDTGVYTIPAGLAAGLWSTQVIIEELDPAGQKVGQVALDFMFEVLAADPAGNAPVFQRPPTPGNASDLLVTPGSTVAFTVAANDPDGDPVVLNTTGIPITALGSPALPSTGANPTVGFQWTPTLDDVGVYSITYTAEDPNGNFVFTSVNICVIPPLNIIEPNGGEAYLPGTRVEISWETVGCPRPSGVRIELSRDGGQSYPEVLAPIAPDTGLFAWVADLPRTGQAKLRIISLDDPTDVDESDGVFTIVGGEDRTICTPPKPTAIPDAEPAWTSIPLNFTSDLIIRGLFIHVKATHPFIGDLEIEVVHPNSASLIAQGLPPNPEDVVLLHDESGEGRDNIDEIYGAGKLVTPPAEPLTKLYGKAARGTWHLRVRDLKPGDVGTLDRWCVQIIGPRRGEIAITAPVEGERLAVGLPALITWTERDVFGTVQVEVSRDAGETWSRIGTVNAGVRRLNWTVTGPPTENARFRVTSVEEPAITDQSAADIIIRNPSLQVLSPNGGEVLSTGRQAEVKWENTPNSGTVSVEFSKDGGKTFTTVAGSAPDNGLFLWTPQPGDDTTRGRIRVRANSGPTRSDLSDRNFTVQTPGVVVTRPAAGAVWYTNTTQTVSWKTVGVGGLVRIELFRNGRWEDLVNSTDNDGTEDVQVVGQAATDARIRVSDASEVSLNGVSATFEIRQMQVRVLSPNGGERLGIGGKHVITWQSEGLPGTVGIEISRNGGRTFTTLFAATANDGRQEWEVTGPATETALLRIRATGLPTFDLSDGVFALVAPFLRVTSPNGGEELRTTATHAITWDTAGLSGRVRVELSRDAGDTWDELFPGTPNDGTENWRVTGPETEEALIRVTSLDQPAVQDTSNSVFSIVIPALTVTSPNGGEIWVTDTTHRITWSADGVGGNVKVELTRNGRTWETLFGNTPNNGRVDWKVRGPGTGSARIRVTSLTDGRAVDESDAPFTILEPSLLVGRPNGGETWLIGMTQTITWGSDGLNGRVHVELSRNGGQSWTRILSNTDNDGVHPWVVTGPATDRARIRITSVERPSASDTSDRNFSIASPTIVVTSPTAGTRWRTKRRHSITWTGTALEAGGTVDIQLSRNGGRSWKTIIRDTENDGQATWRVSGGPSRRARIRVVWKPSRDAQGTSPNFRILRRR